MSQITAPTAATHPAQIEPIFSSRQDERDEGQFLRISVFNSDGTHDFEEGRLADFGCFVPSEELVECEERLTRILRRRIQARLAGANTDKP